MPARVDEGASGRVVGACGCGLFVASMRKDAQTECNRGANKGCGSAAVASIYGNSREAIRAHLHDGVSQAHLDAEANGCEGGRLITDRTLNPRGWKLLPAATVARQPFLGPARRGARAIIST